MALCEDELIAKLKRGEDMPDVMVWFMKKIMELNPGDDDLSPFERAFFGMFEHYAKEWEQKQRKLN
jgi:hypothetical protein